MKIRIRFILYDFQLKLKIVNTIRYFNFKVAQSPMTFMLTI